MVDVTVGRSVEIQPVIGKATSGGQCLTETDSPPLQSWRLLQASAALVKIGTWGSDLPVSPHLIAHSSVLSSCASTQGSPDRGSASVYSMVFSPDAVSQLEKHPKLLHN